MPKGQYTCKVCQTDPFVVPADEIGAAIMEAHFMDKHPEHYKQYLEHKARHSTDE